MKIRNAIPNLITLGNLFCGVLSIILVFEGYLMFACLLIFVGAFLDFIDGFAARLLNAGTDIGTQLDSLSDLVTFGVAPAIIMYHLFYLGFNGDVSFYLSDIIVSGEMLDNSGISYNGINHYGKIYFNNEIIFPDFKLGHWLLIFVSACFPLFSAYRLAKFNSMPASKIFYGLPTPAAGLLIASLPLLLFQEAMIESDRLHWIEIEFLAAGMFLTGITMVSNIPMFSLKLKSFTWKENRVQYVFLSGTVLLLIFGVLIKNIWISVPLIILLYFISSLINNLIRK